MVEGIILILRLQQKPQKKTFLWLKQREMEAAALREEATNRYSMRRNTLWHVICREVRMRVEKYDDYGRMTGRLSYGLHMHRFNKVWRWKYRY